MAGTLKRVAAGTFGLALLLGGAAAGIAQTPAANPPVQASVDAARTGPPISPYLYGQFVEHAGNLTYGLWCEMLDDRKFYYPVGPKPPEETNAAPRGGGFGGARRRGVGPGRWNPVGPANSVTMDVSHPLVGMHSPRVELAGAEPRGISQTGLKLTKGTVYQGRVQLAGDSGARVVLNIVYGTNSDASGQTISQSRLKKDYRKFTFSFAARESGAARLEIVGTGKGCFHVGAVSLMPSDNLFGFKPDAVAVLKSLRSGVYRFPGGNFVSAHEWREAIGDPDKRPPVYDPVWRALQPNDIGTDEFLLLCRLLRVEPYITVNAGFGDAWSAAQYVEYANGPVSSPMGKLRAANGHPEPYRVKFWGVGNEMWGDYQYGYMPLDQFEHKHNLFARAMKRVDPGIQLIACGAMPDTMTGAKQSLKLGTNMVAPYFSPADWTGGLLSNCFDNIDLISDHFYNFGTTHFSLAAGDQTPNDPNEPVTDWMRRPANHIRIKYEEYKEYERLFPRLAREPKPLNIDEWAYMGGRYPTYPSYGWMFQEMFRHTDIFYMAAYTFATSLLVRDGTNVSLNANGQVFKLYRDHFGTIPVAVSGNSPQPKPTDPPGGEQPAVNAGSDTFPLDVAAAWSEARHTLSVAVVNPTDQAQPLKLEIGGAALSGRGTLWRLASAMNDGQNPSVEHEEIQGAPRTVVAPRFSISIYELEAK
jgi:alpha-N-arabinofuranosidase